MNEQVDRPINVTFEPSDPTSSIARLVVGRYYAELNERFTSGFDAASAANAAERDVVAFDGRRGVLVVLHHGSDPIGCAGVQRFDNEAGEIKRMWIDPAWRGQGLGRRLLAHMESLAAELGYRRIVLDTNEVLTEAIAMYQAAGYEAIERYGNNRFAHHWFAKPLPDGSRRR